MVRMASLDGEGGRVFCPGPFGLMFYVFTVIELWIFECFMTGWWFGTFFPTCQVGT